MSYLYEHFDQIHNMVEEGKTEKQIIEYMKEYTNNMEELVDVFGIISYIKKQDKNV